ncbi:brorin-like isoform X2 [Littorina saxatilis]|uniref:brorin-like isoform X2 n=1 Tax=Littorina saxatilis TaxID=31220 RepID=UPI0038B6A796
MSGQQSVFLLMGLLSIATAGQPVPFTTAPEPLPFTFLLDEPLPPAPAASATETSLSPPGTTTTTPNIAVVTSRPGCYYDSGRYKHGDKWEPNACTTCQCMLDRTICYAVDCFFAECVDFEYVPGKCCPMCPNGPNCSLNGTIVSVGEEVQTGPSTTCTCVLPESGAFAFRRPGVMCTTFLERPPQMRLRK